MYHKLTPCPLNNTQCETWSFLTKRMAIIDPCTRRSYALRSRRTDQYASAAGARAEVPWSEWGWGRGGFGPKRVNRPAWMSVSVVVSVFECGQVPLIHLFEAWWLPSRSGVATTVTRSAIVGALMWAFWPVVLVRGRAFVEKFVVNAPFLVYTCFGKE